MYRILKGIIKIILPHKLRLKIEPLLRSFLFWFYKGSTFECNICNRNLRTFISFHNEKICPYCGSLPRTRRLWQLLDEKYLSDHPKILDFSPSRSLYRILEKFPGIEYHSNDLSGDFFASHHFDICNIESKDNSYDLILCFHILEHVENDHKAIRELHRVLKKGGTLLVQTPFKDGTIYENPLILTKKDRIKHFGQSDHVRVYSLNGLMDRLNEAGFLSRYEIFTESSVNRFGFSNNEKIIICSKC